MTIEIATGVVVADGAGWDHMNGWGWGGMAMGWLMMIGVVLLIVWIARGADGAATTPQHPSPLDVLAERFARGEITSDEYEYRRGVLVQSRKKLGK